MLFPKISDALSSESIDLGLTELASHATLALGCQELFAVADIAMMVFLFVLAATTLIAPRAAHDPRD